MTPITDVSGVGPIMARSLAQLGITSIVDLSQAKAETLLAIPGVGMRRAEILIDAARSFAPVLKPESEPEAASAYIQTSNAMIEPAETGADQAELAPSPMGIPAETDIAAPLDATGKKPGKKKKKKAGADKSAPDKSGKDKKKKKKGKKKDGKKER